MATIPASEPRSPAGVHGDSILLAEVLLDLAERAQAYTSSAGVAIALIRGRDLLVRTSTGTAPEVGTTIPLSDGFVSECIRTRKPLTCREVESDSRVGPALRALQTRSLMAIPVCEVRDVRGMMLVIAPLPNSFQPTHISILMTLCDIVAAKLREHESAVQVEIQLFDDDEEIPEIPAEPPTNLSSVDIGEIMRFESEPASAPAAPAMPITAAPAASAASILDPVPPPLPPSVEFPGAPTFRSLFESPAMPPPPAMAIEPPIASTPAPVLPKSPAAAIPAESKPAIAPPEPVAAAPASPVIRPPVVELPVPLAVKAPTVFEPPPAPFAVKAPSVIEPHAPFVVKAQVTPPAPAATKPAVTPPPPAVPPLGSPALPITPALAMMEDKIELGGRDPGLLSPAEDPGRFKRNRTFTASTLKPSVPTTSATTTAKPAPVTPFAVVEPAKPLVELAKTPVAEPAKPAVPETAKPAPFEPAIVSTPAAPAVSMPVPALTTWEESPRENQAKRPWLVPLAAVAAMLVIAVGFWIYSTTSKDAPAPVIPVPGKNAAALPAVAPALPAPAPTAQPPAKTPAAESVKTTKPAETQAAPPAREQEARQPIEIAAGQPKPKEEPEPDVPAPKLSLAAHDPSINSLVRVALPSAPKSDLVPASLVSRVNPLYPSLARQLGVSGTVVMEVKIEKNGSVGAVRVTAGAMQLRQAAIDAVKQWRYKPASLNGSPVESTAEVKVNFIR